MSQKTVVPDKRHVTITFHDGRSETYDTSTPKLLYEVNRLGVVSDEIEASFFLFWVAAGKPNLAAGVPLEIDAARPAMEQWLDTIAEVSVKETEQDGPPTKRRAASRGSAA